MTVSITSSDCLLGLALALISITGLSIYTGLNHKKNNAGVLSSGVVTGLLLGTFIGGSSTIGTAQLAYNYGMSACWFTLGGAIACCILALVYTRPLRRKNSPTLIGAIATEYGEKTGFTATILNAAGTFINVFAQLLAASAVIQVIAPSVSTIAAIIFTAVIMLAYVVFGGTRGAGIVGLLKLVLISLSMCICGALAINLQGGFSATLNHINLMGESLGRPLLSPFCRGFWIDSGACLSLILGVLTTQTYAQAILNARTDKAAVTGALTSAAIIPLIGLCGIFVGLYMRTVTDPSVFNTKTALTTFILEHAGLSPFVAGIFLGTLFIATVGAGAGLSLGIATMIERDLLKQVLRKYNISSGIANRLLIAFILCCATCLYFTPLGDTILRFAFLSMGLRGCTVFAPLCFALWAPGVVAPLWAFISVIAGSLTSLCLGLANLFGVITLPFDSVFIGITVGLLVMFAGLITKKYRPKESLQ